MSLADQVLQCMAREQKRSSTPWPAGPLGTSRGPMQRVRPLQGPGCPSFSMETVALLPGSSLAPCVERSRCPAAVSIMRRALFSGKEKEVHFILGSVEQSPADTLTSIWILWRISICERPQAGEEICISFRGSSTAFCFLSCGHSFPRVMLETHGHRHGIHLSPAPGSPPCSDGPLQRARSSEGKERPNLWVGNHWLEPSTVPGSQVTFDKYLYNWIVL
jgi:hypothetical protein